MKYYRYTGYVHIRIEDENGKVIAYAHNNDEADAILNILNGNKKLLKGDSYG